MTTTHPMATPLSPQTLKSKLRDYYTLTKPEVNLLILMTTSAGYYLASRGPLRIGGLLNTLLGTLLVASGTATLNQWMERVWDGKMRRTASRPVPSGRITGRDALLFGTLLSVAGGFYLLVAVNALSAVLAVSTLLSYLLVYTPLKRKTPLCTLLGAFPGAMPTLIGWAGASATLNRQAWFLFAILFLWQFPHYRDDYSRAGYRMLPDFDLDTRFTRLEIVGFALILVLTTMLPPLLGGAGLLYGAGMGVAGAFLLYHVGKLAMTGSKIMASRLLHASVLYLPVVLVIMAASKK
jgi:heme o synthase